MILVRASANHIQKWSVSSFERTYVLTMCHACHDHVVRTGAGYSCSRHLHCMHVMSFALALFIRAHAPRPRLAFFRILCVCVDQVWLGDAFERRIISCESHIGESFVNKEFKVAVDQVSTQANKLLTTTPLLYWEGKTISDNLRTEIHLQVLVANSAQTFL